MVLRARLRLVVALSFGACAVLIGSVAAAASSGGTGQSALRGTDTTLVSSAPASGASISGRADVAAGSICPAVESRMAAAAPAIVCGPFPTWNGQPGQTGVTATGTATANGIGKSARDEAIRNAIADARDQAAVAAQAAGARLGRVIGIQISSYPMPVPMVTGGAVRGGLAAPACLPGSACPTPARHPSVTASVTVTWALS